MRWFGGMYRHQPGLLLRPSDTRPLWGGPTPLWLGGDWPPSQARVLTGDGWRVAVLGDCPDPEHRLRRLADRYLSGCDTMPLAGRSGSSHVVWCDSEGIVVAGDAIGARPIFYVQHDAATLFGSDAAPLADLASGDPDTEWLAINLACPEVTGDMGLAPFTGVQMVPPGHALHLNHQGVIYRAQPLEWPDADPEDSAASLRDALTTAVSSRIHPGARVTSDVSGGLDSSSVTALACAAGARVAGLTLASGQPDNDDISWAREVASSLPRLRHEVRRLPDAVLPYTDLESVPVTDEPAPDVAVHARTRWWHQQLGELGSDAHLCGDGGDAVLVATPAYLADIARTGRFDELVTQSRHWARLCPTSPARILAAACRAAATPRTAAIRRLARRIESPRHASIRPSVADMIGAYPPPTGSAWLSTEARRVAAKAARSMAASASDDWPIGDQAALRALRTFARTHRTDRQIADHYGIALAAPFLDKAVVRACLAVPARVRTSTTVAKPLLRAALRGYIPEMLLTRSTKGDYTQLHYRGVARNAGALRALVVELQLAELGIVDQKAVCQTVEHAIAGQRVRIGVLDSIIAAELWLRAHQRRQPIRWASRKEVPRDPLPLTAEGVAGLAS